MDVGWPAGRRPRLVHVIPTFRIAGLENVVVRLAGALREHADQLVLTPDVDGPLRDRFPSGVRLRALREVGRSGRWNVFRMASVFREFRPDIVHSRNWSCIDGVIGGALARVPVIVHGEHGRTAEDPLGRNRKRRVVRRLLAPWVDRFVTVSEDLARWLVEDVRIAARKVVHIPNGVDTERFSPEGREQARRSLDVPYGATVFGCVGRLDPVKDHASLLRAFAAVGSGGAPVLLLLAGEGPMRAAIEAEIRRLGLDARVRLLGERSDVPDVLRALDVFLLPSVGEGMSNSILEAMAAGLPVIATRVGGNPQLVRDGATGTLVAAGDPEGLAAAMRRYLGEPELRAAHGRAARLRSEAEFSLTRMVAAYSALYAGLLREKAR